MASASPVPRLKSDCNLANEATILVLDAVMIQKALDKSRIRTVTVSLEATAFPFNFTGNHNGHSGMRDK